MSANTSTRPTIPNPQPIETPVAVKDLPAAVNHAVSIGGVRYDLFQRDNNGLSQSGALLFRGRRILVYPRRYLAWMEARSAGQR